MEGGGVGQSRRDRWRMRGEERRRAEREGRREVEELGGRGAMVGVLRRRHKTVRVEHEREL